MVYTIVEHEIYTSCAQDDLASITKRVTKTISAQIPEEIIKLESRVTSWFILVDQAVVDMRMELV